MIVQAKPRQDNLFHSEISLFPLPDKMKSVDNSNLRTAGRVAGKLARNANRRWAPTIRNSQKLVKHVVPAAVKPLHSLWHQILGFTFLVFAVFGGFDIWRNASTTPPLLLGFAGFLVLILAIYGLSSVLKARRISRS